MHKKYRKNIKKAKKLTKKLGDRISTKEANDIIIAYALKGYINSLKN